MNYKISCAVPETVKGKATTFGYTELPKEHQTQKGFIEFINKYATIPVAVTGGHRHMDNVTEIFGWLRFDLDEEGEEAILEPLIQDYYYIKKPSTNNDEFPYKWHYFVQVSNPAQNYDQFKDQVLQFCKDIKLKDMAVTNSVTQNMNPYKGDLKRAIELTTVNEGKTLALPEPREIAPAPVADGIHFTDLDTGEVSEVVVGMGSDELRERLATIDASCDRATWMAYNASAYNIASDKKEARNLCLEWSQTANNFTEDGFEDLWIQIENGAFGKKYKGGMLIKDSNDSGYIDPVKEKETNNFEDLCERITNASTVDEIKSLAKEGKGLKYAYQTQLPSLMKDRASTIDKEHKHSVAYFKTLFDLAGAKKREEIEQKKKSKEAQKESASGIAKFVKVYFNTSTNKYYVIEKATKKFHNDISSQGLITTGNGLGIVGEVFRDYATTKSVLISDYTKETDYLTKDKVSYVEKDSQDASASKVLHILTNPLTDVPEEFTGKMDIVEDFHKDIWNGKAHDVIELVALSMRYKETKLTRLHLVAPSDAGKSRFLINMTFKDITMQRLISGMTSEKGIGKPIVDGIKASGFMLIDEANKPLTQEIKDMDNYLKVDQFGAQGGTQEIKLHFTVLTSTHKKAIRNMSDEMFNRLLCVELFEDEMAHSVVKSPLFSKYDDHGDIYTDTVTAYNMWLLKDMLTNPRGTREYYKKLQSKYRLELDNDVDALLSDISDSVISEYRGYAKGASNDTIERNGQYYIKRKRDLQVSIEDLLSEHSHLDVGKYSEKLMRHFLGEQKTKSVKVDGKPIKYYPFEMKTLYATVEDEQDATVMALVTNLDTGEKVDEVDEFLS